MVCGTNRACMQTLPCSHQVCSNNNNNISEQCPSPGRVSEMLRPHNSDGCGPEASSPQVYHVQSQGAKNQTESAQSGAGSQGNCQGGPL